MGLLDVLFPAECVGCSQPGRVACAACIGELAGAPRLAWPRPSPPGLPPPWAVAAYAGPVRSMLLSYKDRNAVGLARVLAEPLAAAIVSAAGEGWLELVVVPVPSSTAAIRERGSDVMLTLARRAAVVGRRAGVAMRVVQALRHSRRVADSAGLSAAARADNLANAFAIQPGMAAFGGHVKVVVADDVLTTGATLAEATRALREGGVTVAGAAVVAATRRRGDTALLGGTPNGATVGAIGSTLGRTKGRTEWTSSSSRETPRSTIAFGRASATNSRDWPSSTPRPTESTSK